MVKEYAVEDGNVNVSNLKAGFMRDEDYRIAHEHLIIPCHDVFIQYGMGLLLVRRLNFPARDILWPLGGRIKRGLSIEESLKERIRGESGLDLYQLRELGCGRTYFSTDPFGHGKGTDTINFVFFAVGFGELNLDKLHESPTIVSPEEYSRIREGLHPYVKDFMDLAIPLVR